MENQRAELAAIDFDSLINGSAQETLQKGAALFLEQGYLIIKNAYDKNLIKGIHDEFMSEYESYFGDARCDDALEVGHRRRMVTLKLKGLVNSPDYYANPKIFTLMKFLLGEDLIINSLGGVVSLPNSQNQHVHRDHWNIYVSNPPVNDNSWIRHAPPYAITVGIPLIPMTKETGHTRFWPGSHLHNYDPKDPRAGDWVDYEADIGTVVLFDYRLIHAGMANKSNQVRPLLYNIYSKPWFRDVQNYSKQVTMHISDEDYEKIPVPYRRLIDWTRPVKGAHTVAVSSGHES